MATTNTKALLFTQLPREITKTWERKVVDLAGSTVGDYCAKYVLSPVESVSLQIQFTSEACEAPTVFYETDDAANDRMPFVQQQAKLFDALESAVQRAIDQYSDQLTRLARERGLPAAEIPSRKRTVYALAKESAATSSVRGDFMHRGKQYPDLRSDVSPPSILKVRTVLPTDDIAPSESMSNSDTVRRSTQLNVDELARIFNVGLAMDRGRNTKRSRQRSRSRRRNTSRARTIMSYASGH